MSNNRGAWTRKRMFEIGDFYNGLSGKVKEDFLDGNAKFVTYMNVYKNMFAKNDMVESVLIRENESQTIVRYGDILFSQSSETLEEVGLTSVWLNSAEVYLNSFCFGFRIADKKILDSKYAGYLFRSYQIRKRIVKEGQGNIRVNLSSSRLRNLELCLPPLPEQKKIAEILSTWDEAIELHKQHLNFYEIFLKSLWKYQIEKILKESVNDIFSLSKITLIKKGKQRNKNTLVETGYPVINGGIEPSGYTDKWNTQSNTITISEGGNSCGFVNFIDERFWSGGHCYTIHPKDIADNKYLYYYLKSKQKEIQALRVGSGLPNIQKKDIDAFQILLPSMPKQIEIVQLMDLGTTKISKINELIRQLTNQKQGLMQRLLTGKVRVKLD